MSVEVYFILAILGLPVFFLWRRIFKNSKLSNGNKQAAIWVSTIISTPIVYVSIISAWILFATYYPEKEFDKQQWQNDKELRYQMSADIIESKMLIGKNKTQVAAILGQPGDMKSDDWYYDLGFVPSILSIDPDVLYIVFKNGKVISVSQYRS